MRKGFLAAVGATLIAGGTASSQAPYGNQYSPGYTYYGQQPAAYANGYGYPNGYGYASYAGYAPQMTYRYAYAPGYGYYAVAVGYASPAQQVPAAYAAPRTLPENPPPVPAADASVVTNAPEVADAVAAPPEAAQAPIPAPAEPKPVATIPPPVPPAAVSSDAPDTCCPAADCRRPTRLYGTTEYLLWWIKGDPLPPLLTQGGHGIIGAPGVNVVLGDEELDAKVRSGGRFTVGGYLGDGQTLAVEGSYFFLGQRSGEQSASSNGSSVLFIPFINPLTTPPAAASILLNGSRGLGTGSVTVSSFLQGAEANAVWNLYNQSGLRLGVLGGFRYLQLHEKLTYSFTNAEPAFTFSSTDEFDTDNQFYGGQLGLRAEWTRGRFFALTTGKVALGSMQESVDISGSSTGTNSIFGPGTVTRPGGFFAQGTNFGHHTLGEFAVVPEATFNVGVNITRNISAFVGYNFLDANNVLRPGNQIDTQVNPSQVPGLGGTTGNVIGPARPQVQFNQSDFWAQGINFGLEFRF
jgi:Putative beta barrel porin-7 (BBP7)